MLSAELAATAAGGVDPDPDGDEDGEAEAETPWDLEVPLPGRHAARRPRERARLTDLVADAVPETLQGRVRLGAPQLAVVAIVVAAGLLLTAWWTVRSRSSGETLPPVAAVSGLQTPSASGTVVGVQASASPPASDGGSAAVVVDVTGRVRRPGIVVLPTGSRVVDALEAAGGARRHVDLSGLNQARVLLDGEQITVGVASPSGVAGPAASSGNASGNPSGQLIDVNTADETLLEQLPGVGPVTAQAIIDWRSENGAFTSVDELLEVTGIGDATLADLAPYVTI